MVASLLDLDARWQPAQIDGCPFGRLFHAVCSSDPPASALASLLSSEHAYALTLAGTRRREWVGGRICLAAAIGDSHERRPMLVNALGAPIAPPGWSASVSHKGPVVVALAAATTGAVGVDVERVERIDDRLARKVLTEAERECLPTDDEARRRFVVMHFSVKEAVYKAMAPEDQDDLDFEDIETVLADLVPRCWASVDARVRGSHIRAAIVFDGDWLVATAMRE